MATTTTVNGLGHDYLFHEGSGSHLRQGFIQSQAFREGVEQIVAEQIKTGSAEVTSSHVNRYVGPVAPISDIRGADALNYRKGEKVLRCKLAACYRLASIYRWDDGLYCSITARLAKESDQFLIEPFGVLCDEVTAANLVKVNIGGNIVDNGCTPLGVCPESVALHGALFAARSDINCAFFISSPLAISLSVLKCGLLPLCPEAMVVGEISYADYVGSLAYPENCQQLIRSFGRNSKVLFLCNVGVIVGGETIEETFHFVNNLMTAMETQMTLVPVGLNNLHFPSKETLQVSNNTERELPPGVNAANKWCYGEVEFEALMRQLDNAGYCTGYIYRDSASRQKALRSYSATDVPTTSVSSFSEDKDVANLSQLLMQRRSARPEWTVSPNTYHKEEYSGRDTPLDKKSLAKWVSDTSSVGLSKPRSSSVRAPNTNKFAPQGSNPRELREKVKEIRKEYYQDSITAGPQSTILEGLTWEEARRIKAGQTVGGFDDVLVSAASRGIIQRDHQPKALFYKNFQLGNPFEHVTDRELEQYKKDVEKKSGKGVEASLSDSEMDRRFDAKQSVVVDQGRKSVDSELYLRETKPMPPVPVIRVPVLETNVDDVLPPVQSTVKPVLMPQSQPKAPEPVVHREPEQLKAPARPEISEQDQLQRTQSARFPERTPETKKEKNFLKSGSFRLSKKSAPAHDVLLDAPSSREGTLDRSSKENSPAGDGGSLTKDKKKKRGFRLPSFSKKKEKQ